MAQLSAVLAPYPSPEAPSPARRFFAICPALCAATAILALSGCAVSREIPVSAAGTAMHGSVHGGQQPVAGSTIQLWAAGTGGNRSAATPLLTTLVQTDAGGGFDITGDYSCPSATTQVYITATGGNPGFASPVNNGALALVASLGNCGGLATIPGISISELTTVAAAWGLAPFASSTSNVAASATNTVGLQNAMLTAMLLTDSSTGQSPSANLPANATVETAKLITLADILADCVNSDGGAVCANMFADATPAGSAAPVDTFQAALMIVQNPGNNVQSLFYDTPAHAAFGGALAQVPHDWTMSIGYSGGGMGTPGAVSIDANGSVWVANRDGGVAGFAAQGSPIFLNGIVGGGLSGTKDIAIDASGFIWAANSLNVGAQNPLGSVVQLAPWGQVLSSPLGYVAGLNVPSGVAIAPNGKVWVSNWGGSSVALLDEQGSPLSGLGYGLTYLNRPVALAATAASDVWVANAGSGKLTLINASGLVLKNVSCCDTPDSLALDASGNIWVADSTHNDVKLISSNGAFATVTSTASFQAPVSPAIDGAGSVFLVNSGANSVTKLLGSGAVVEAGLGLDARLQQPVGSALDASGNLWVSSSADARLVQFVGMGSPVKTPLIGLPVAP